MDTLASLGGSKVISGPHLLRRPYGSPTTFFCSFHEKPKYLIIISDKTRIHILYIFGTWLVLYPIRLKFFWNCCRSKILRKYTIRDGGSDSSINDFFGSISEFIVFFAWLYRLAKQNVTGSGSEEVKGRPCTVICRTVLVVMIRGEGGVRCQRFSSANCSH